MGSEKLRLLVEMLKKRLENRVEKSRQVLRWLKVVVESNLAAATSDEEVRSALREVQQQLQRKAQLMGQVLRMKKKLACVVQRRRLQEDAAAKGAQTRSLKPLLLVEGGTRCLNRRSHREEQRRRCRWARTGDSKREAEQSECGHQDRQYQTSRDRRFGR